ncbi:hypothetical protein IFM89_025658 [Coptis chinensis]|uniref:F-box domain-containing protein n=1 Tax=Coptis chinensis TaxID=261450 RepID=A0A835H8W7_9MAGN|nr:hypothetical protein IFM89_025658 [Coptis chinensis]
MVIYFSKDIMFEILVKVPAKDLLRAKVVCKLWHSIISDPNFVNSQLAHSRSQPPEIILKIYSSDYFEVIFEMFTITTQKHGIMQVEKICDMKFPPLQFPCTESTVKASCNGLLLIFHGKHPFETLYVYNPVTRQYVALPSMTEPLDMSCNPPRCYYSWTLFYKTTLLENMLCLERFIRGALCLLLVTRSGADIKIPIHAVPILHLIPN